MLSVTYRKHGMRISHVWFATEDEIKSNAYKKNAGNLIVLHGCSVMPLGGELYTTQHTLIKDLRPSETELFLTLGKHLRQYIKRSEKENLIDVKIFSSQDMHENRKVLFECKRLYEKMFNDKGMHEVFNLKLANKYLYQEALSIAVAYDGKEAIGFSAIIHQGKDARLWLAAFDFRNENLNSQVLSRAHQRLDWKLLCWCKKMGIYQFDFGGVNSFSNPNGIAQFKMKFESENRVTYNNYLVPNNLMGKLGVKAFMRRI